MSLFRKIFGRSRTSTKGVLALALYIDKQPHLIEEMINEISKHDPERAQQFSVGLENWYEDEKAINSFAMTFFIYRTFICNKHPQEMKWWRESYKEQGISIGTLSMREIETSAVYLRSLGLGIEDINEALEFYRDDI